MAYWDHDYREPTLEERTAALEKLASLANRAKEIEEGTLEKRKALAKEFNEFVNNDGLRFFEYDGAINGAVEEFENLVRGNDWNSTIELWIPSNIGC